MRECEIGHGLGFYAQRERERESAVIGGGGEEQNRGEDTQVDSSAL